MFTRLRAALRVLVSGPDHLPGLAPTCARCAELKEEVRYWRQREERTADAFLASKGVMSLVAAPPAPSRPGAMAVIAKGMGVTEIDTSKSKQPGQGAVTRGSDRAN